ncbi:MAG: hypothetical protein NTU41_12945 [Chloroflexi bacterium]|nr:hypothetical protein [Chloroflexota bacterium]
MTHLRAGMILRINLSTGEIGKIPVDAHAERFIGSKGINVKMLFDGVEPDTRPFDPGNLLLFGAGPLVGTPFPGACRTDVMARSPVSGGLGDSSMGGYFAGELKFAGYDNLVVEGRADKPVYMYIRDERVEIRDASAIWGQDTVDTPALIRGELRDPKTQVACIGPAGERRVLYASIVAANGSVAARSGLGAVMGSKNLKAVAVRGTRGISVARPREFLDECRKARYAIEQHPAYLTLREGTSRHHDFEWRMFASLRGGWWPGAENICEEEFSRRYPFRGLGCLACPLACCHGYDIAGVGSGSIKCSPYGDLTWGVRNPDHLVMLQTHLDCQRYGLDTRSVSAMLAWLMELHANGIISAQDTDGIPMEYGSPQAIQALPRKVSYREGIGDLLANGLPAAARSIGRGAEEYLRTAKGSPIDINLPATKGRGLAYALAATGEGAQAQPYIMDILAGKYLESDGDSFERALRRHKERAEKEMGIKDAPDPTTVMGKAALLCQGEDRAAICDMTGVCSWMTPFIGLPVDAAMIAMAMTAGQGTETTTQTLFEAAARLRHVERAFGIRCGLSREDDVVSSGFRRQLNGAVPELGFTEAELEKMKDDYYRLVGWDVPTGTPAEETLRGAGLADVAERLKSVTRSRPAKLRSSGLF